jgi:hypothetical protein
MNKENLQTYNGNHKKESLKEHLHVHTHNHSHAHMHPHIQNEEQEINHIHTHSDDGHQEHIHGDSESEGLTKEEKTLKILLSHWVEHNKSHEEGFKEWIEKSKAMGKEETANFIQKAIDFMEKADGMLEEAKKRM